ncbi:MAG: sporulation protein [Gammaproteobacteria bacterium]|jgi:cell division protein FtsN|nr:sporulation protein [Gammaproteobacteria bacterium]
MKNRKQKSNGYRFLWFFTGMLVMLFICGLLFLKKRVTIVTNGSQSESIVVTNDSKNDNKKPSKPHHADPAHNKTHNTDSTTNDQYDFYTMLPKMQVKQPAPPPAPQAPAPAPKPTKPLANAEQAMLAPQQQAPAATTQAASNQTAAAPATSTLSSNAALQAQTTPASPAQTTAQPAEAPSPAPAATPPAAAPKYAVVAGETDNPTDADSLRAQLILTGAKNIKIQKYMANGTAKYRVIIGRFYTSQAEATAASKQLANDSIQTKVITLS